MTRVLWLVVLILFSGLGAAARSQDHPDPLRPLLREAISASPTPKTLQTRHQAWLDGLEGFGPSIPAEHVERHRERLRTIIDRADAMRADRLQPTELPVRCLSDTFSSCRVQASGALALADGELIHWQKQAGEAVDASTMVVLLRQQDDGLAPMAWVAEHADLQPPVLLPARPDGTVHVAIGDGPESEAALDHDSLFRWVPGGPPVEIDTASWRADVDRRLPVGLGILSAVAFDWTELTASSSLWQVEGDDRCCPSGGYATLSFDVDGNDVLVLLNIAAVDRILNVAREVPPDLLAWLARNEQCRWFQEGEGAQLHSEQPAYLACDRVGADVRRLKTIYGDSRRLMALIARAERQPR